MQLQLKPESQSIGKQAALNLSSMIFAGCHTCASSCNLPEVGRAGLNSCKVRQSLVSSCRTACLWACD